MFGVVCHMTLMHMEYLVAYSANLTEHIVILDHEQICLSKLLTTSPIYQQQILGMHSQQYLAIIDIYYNYEKPESRCIRFLGVRELSHTSSNYQYG